MITDLCNGAQPGAKPRRKKCPRLEDVSGPAVTSIKALFC